MVRHRLKQRFSGMGFFAGAAVLFSVALVGCSWLPWSAEEEQLHPAAEAPTGRMLDSDASFVVFTGQVGSDVYQGKFQHIEGVVAFSDGPQGSVLDGGAMELHIPVTSLRTQHDAFTARLLGADFFDATAHPLIDFRSTSIILGPDGVYLINGILSFRGREKPMELQAQLQGNVITMNTIVDRGQSAIDSLNVSSVVSAEARLTMQ